MASTSAHQNPIRAVSLRIWVQLSLTYLLIPLVLLLCGGDLAWWQAWVYSSILFLAGIGARMWSEQRHPGLIQERAKFVKSKDTKPWDIVLAPLMAVSISFPLVIVAGLDHRFTWSPAFPIWLNLLGFIINVIGYAFATWALVENRFFSGVVRIQTDRGHFVCDTGPYKYIRHPGYAGNILPLAGTVLALSSLWTIIPALFALVIVILRTAFEDRTLQHELPGYQEYTQRVHYRLFPFIY